MSMSLGINISGERSGLDVVGSNSKLSDEAGVRLSLRRHLLLSVALSLFILPGLAGWTATTSISGAVIAPGQLVVETDLKKVQHPIGGVVAELLVREGSRVRTGDLLVRLDETQTRASLDVVRKALDELTARRARDEAERDGGAVVVYPPEFLALSSAHPEIAALIDGESKLFTARQTSRSGQKAQLNERIAQIEQEIIGLTEQVGAKSSEIALIDHELRGVRDLYSRNLVALSRVTTLERDATRLIGERGQLTASIASARGKVAETRLQILQVDAEMRAEVGKDLGEIRGKWSELVERRIAAEDQLKRIEMRAPQDGIVHQMTVHTVGGLIVPSEPAMLIVPDADRLVVEVRIRPQDIDSVRLGQQATLRMNALNARTTPEVSGTVSRLSADVTVDPRSGQSYYTARVEIGLEEIDRLGEGQRLMPGMPVEAHLKIGERTVLSYLTRPLADQITKAWRER